MIFDYIFLYSTNQTFTVYLTILYTSTNLHRFFADSFRPRNVNVPNFAELTLSSSQSFYWLYTVPYQFFLFFFWIKFHENC